MRIVMDRTAASTRVFDDDGTDLTKRLGLTAVRADVSARGGQGVVTASLDVELMRVEAESDEVSWFMTIDGGRVEVAAIETRHGTRVELGKDGRVSITKLPESRK